MMRKILLILLVALLLIQFIRPTRNISEGKSGNHISNKYNVPASVSGILEKSCYDCHSNNTVYPWYTNIQPVGLWLQNHVNEGKGELNFSEFLAYSPKKARHKLDEVMEMVNEGEMPLESYTLIHKNAKLSSEEKTVLADWASLTMKQIEKDNNLPPEEKK
jgi:hypothetical protein